MPAHSPQRSPMSRPRIKPRPRHVTIALEKRDAHCPVCANRLKDLIFLEHGLDRCHHRFPGGPECGTRLYLCPATVTVEHMKGFMIVEIGADELQRLERQKLTPIEVLVELGIMHEGRGSPAAA